MKMIISTPKSLFVFFIVANTIFLIGLYMFMNEISIPISRFILLISAVLNILFYIFLFTFLYKKIFLKG